MNEALAGTSRVAGTVGALVREAEALTTPPGRLGELATHRSARVRAAVAQNAVATDDVVVHLATDPDHLVRSCAASNAAGRPDVEGALAESDDKWVRAILAHTYATSHTQSLQRETQQTLARDEFWESRARTAETTQYRDLFDLLLGDPVPRVRASCAANLRATRADIDLLLADRNRSARAIAVAMGTHFPDDEQVLRAARDRSVEVRWQALMRAGAPTQAVASLLLDDPDDLVRSHAQLVAGGGTVWEPSGEARAVAERSALPRLAFVTDDAVVS